MSRRVAWLILGLVWPISGCATGGRLWPVRPDASASERLVSPIASAKTEIAQRINRNAQPVEALTASTQVSAEGRRFGGGLNGQMALERPRNFKLRLERTFGTPEVDVGSNDEEFWFWSKQSEDKAIYVGRYDGQGGTPAELMFRPDWIVEALGLRPISTAELSQTEIARGREPNTLVLTHHRAAPEGGTQVKQTVVDEATQRVRKHIFYGNDQKTPVAVVTPSGYQNVAESAGDGRVGATVELPQRIQLRLIPTRDPQDQLTLDIALRDIRVNPALTDTNRQALFSVPSYSGYAVVDLNRRSANYASQGDGRSYESRPMPSLDENLEPAEGALRSDEGAWLHRGDPVPLQADLAAGTSEPLSARQIVRPGIPTAPVQPYERLPDFDARRLAERNVYPTR